jgi:MASE1
LVSPENCIVSRFRRSPPIWLYWTAGDTAQAVAYNLQVPSFTAPPMKRTCRAAFKSLVSRQQKESRLHKVETIVVVAVAYLVLGMFSAFFAYSDQGAWSVWLNSGLVLGLVLARVRSDWLPVLAGAFLGALIFEPLVGSSLGDSFGYALIEVFVTVVGGLVASRISQTPLHFESPRDVGAVIAGAFALALTGAVLTGLWDYFTGQPDAWRTFRVWLVGNFAAILLLAPFIAAWAQLRLKRPDTRTLFSIAGGVLACALFVLCVQALFGARAGRSPGWFAVGFTSLSVLLFVLVALLWGVRGSTLAALVAAMIAITQTVRGFGPFTGSDQPFGDAVLNAQGYAVALSMAGLLLATVIKRRRLVRLQPPG